MWLAMHLPPETEERAERERFYETLLGISPDVYIGPTVPGSQDTRDTALVFLGAVSRYWKLNSLAFDGTTPSTRTEATASLEASVHPFLKKLLRQPFNPSLFVVAPTQSLAYALLSLQHSDFVELSAAGRSLVLTQAPKSTRQQVLCWYTLKDVATLLTPLAPRALLHLVPDILEKKSTHGAFEYFFESAQELGLDTLKKLLSLLTGPAQEALFLERFGRDVMLALKRLRGQDRMKTQAYKAPVELVAKFYPQFEIEVSSENEADLPTRFLQILSDWEDQLRLRKASLKGLELRLKAPKPLGERCVQLPFTRPTRNAQKLFKVLQERILARDNSSAKSEHFTFEIFEEIQLRSLGLAQEQDKQLSLFDPKKEESAEDWSLLVSELQSMHPQVKVGAYAAYESYFPEHSVEWIPWGEDEHLLKSLAEHPPRPERIFEVPKPYKKTFCNEVEFLTYVQAQKSQQSLERIRDPWRNAERSYARVDYDWIFWDHMQARCYVHGVFEESKNQILEN